ncbi:MAG: response regulator [Bacteroidetes bacterium]|nr:response regulator [Bacteroidota bacterium]
MRNKVILVEDNKAQADLAKIIYLAQSIPVELIHCPDGEDFLQLLPTLNQQEIIYVLLDLNMPKIDGYKVLEVMSSHENWKNMAVIIFSTSSNEADIQKCYELGARAYVTKPLDLDEFDKTIQAIHGFWGEVNLKPIMN